MSHTQNQTQRYLNSHLQNKAFKWQDFPQLLQSLQLDDSPAGGALVVYYQGGYVVDTSVGYANEALVWTTDTLSLNFSTGKGVLATLVHCLVSAGLLEYERAIANYWIEFGVNGKDKITLGQVLSHQANLFAIDSIIDDAEIMLDFDEMVQRVANMSTSVPNGNYPHGCSAYSALVYGWVLAGLIERVTGLRLQQALETYLTKPLGIENSVFFGVPIDRVGEVAQPVRRFSFDQQSIEDKPAKKSRRKPVIRPDSQNTLQTYASLPSYSMWLQQWQQLNSLQKKFIETADINSLYFDLSLLNKANYKSALISNVKQEFDYYEHESLQATIPAVNCVASAKVIAKIYAMLANSGTYQDKTLINQQTFSKLTKVQSELPDAVMPATNPKSMHWRLGFHRVFSTIYNVKNGFGHMGYNGSVTWCDPSRQLAVVYIHNFDTSMLNDVRQFAVTEAVLGCV